MRLPNRDGEQVDAVPMFVAVATAFLIGYAWGPLYFMALGYSLQTSLAIVSVLFVSASALAFHKLFWTARPRDQRPNAGAHTFQLIVYGVLICMGLLLLLAMPLVLP